MKILLTGHKGFIGSHLLKALEEKNHKVSTYEWGEQYISARGFDWVIHIGAISSTTERDIEKILTQNFDFTKRLYNECARHDVGFQFASSASLYGLGTNFKEDAPVDPRTPYAWSKYLCERYFSQYPISGHTQAFRYFNVYGPEGEAHKGNQASPFFQFEKQAKETGQIKVFENSDKYLRDFIPVEEVVHYHLKFLEQPVSGTYNIGMGQTMSFLDVAKQVAEKYDAQIVTIPMPENLKASYQEYTCADMTKTHQTLAAARSSLAV